VLLGRAPLALIVSVALGGAAPLVAPPQSLKQAGLGPGRNLIDAGYRVDARVEATSVPAA
jgi:hypothetical protein